MAASTPPDAKKPPPSFPGVGFAARRADLFLLSSGERSVIPFALLPSGVLHVASRLLLFSITTGDFGGVITHMFIPSFVGSNRPMSIRCQRRRCHSGG